MLASGLNDAGIRRPKSEVGGKMKLDESHPLNRPVILHVRRKLAPENRGPSLSAPENHPDPYLHAGSHPDVVEWIWDRLGAALPNDCRTMFYGAPALVHPKAGIVMALAYGTQYLIRVPDDAIQAALDGGCRIENVWSNGEKTDLEQELSVGWLFGCWSEREKDWLNRFYAELESEPSVWNT